MSEQDSDIDRLVAQMAARLDRQAMEVAARLHTEGLALPAGFVRDVLENYLQELDPDWRARPNEQAVVKRVARALYEDESVIGRVIEAAHRALAERLLANADPPEDEDAEDRPTGGGRSC